MESVLEKIRQADGSELDYYLHAVVDRYHLLCPDKEMTVFVLDKEGDQNTQLDNIIAFMQRLKNRHFK